MRQDFPVTYPFLTHFTLNSRYTRIPAVFTHLSPCHLTGCFFPNIHPDTHLSCVHFGYSRLANCLPTLRKNGMNLFEALKKRVMERSYPSIKSFGPNSYRNFSLILTHFSIS